MNFNDYLDKYKKGTLSPEEAERVKKEIEKYKAITGYICEEDKEGSSLGTIDEKHVNRKKVRNMFISVVIIISLIVISTLWIDWSYYNPNKGYASKYGDRSGQFFIDTSAFTELHSPGYYTNWAEAKSKNFGRYDISINQTHTFTREDKTYRDEVVRGKVTDLGSSMREFWNFPYGNAFGDINYDMESNEKVHNNQRSEDRKYYVDELKKVPSYARVSAYFGFENYIPLKQFEKVYKGSEGLYFSYVAVEVEDYQDIVGFEPTGNGVILDKGVVPEDKYPYFELGNHIDELQKSPVKVWEGHFKTLLKYMSTREEFLSAMANVNNIGTDFYKNSLSYVNKNGINIYGVLVHGSAKDILEFEQQSNISSILVDDVKLSSLSR